MIDIQKMIECEISFPGLFTELTERLYGKLFYNPDNPESHDSNHAIILRLDRELNEAFEDIVTFYEEKGLIPRIYPSYQPGEEEILQPYFEQYGFHFQQFDNSFLVWQNESTIHPTPEITVTRAYTLDDSIIDIILSENEGDWTVRVLERHLLADRLHFLVGYLDEKPITMASVNIMEGLSRVDNVITHKAYRSRGYGRALIHFLVTYHANVSHNTLYLYASDPTALRIYREAGFVDIEQRLHTWSAWKTTI